MSFVTIIEKLDSVTAKLDQVSERIYVTGRPANEIILDEDSFREMLKISKRTASYWRERGLITYSKLGGKIYYRLSDVLALIQQHVVPAVTSNLKIAL